MTDTRASAPPVPMISIRNNDEEDDNDNESSNVEKTTFKLIQDIPDVIESIDALIDPLFELGGDNEVVEEDFSNKYKDGNNAVRLAFELFSKLYDSRQILDELRSVIPVLKDTIKKREQELMKKKARLSKLQPIVDEVKNNTAAICELSKELNKANQGVSSELKSYSSVLQKSNIGQKTTTTALNNARAIKTAVKEIFTDEDRKKNIILFGLEEGENVSLDNKVDEVFLEIGQKPVLVQVVRLGQPTERCRPVRVSLKSSDTVHSILKDSPRLKSSARFSKVYISSDRTPKQRIKHKELVEELKNKIQEDSSRHWKISKGGVTFAEIKDPVPEAIPAKVDITPSSSKEPLPGASEGDIESVKEKSPVKEKRRKSYNFRRHRFTLHHSDYEST